MPGGYTGIHKYILYIYIPLIRMIYLRIGTDVAHVAGASTVQLDIPADTPKGSNTATWMAKMRVACSTGDVVPKKWDDTLRYMNVIDYVHMRTPGNRSPKSNGMVHLKMAGFPTGSVKKNRGFRRSPENSVSPFTTSLGCGGLYPLVFGGVTRALKRVWECLGVGLSD